MLTLFENASLIEAGENKGDAHVLVEGTKIKEVSDKPISVSGDVRRFDVKGKTLMAGLMDAHVHVKALSVDLSTLHLYPSSYMTARASEIMQGMLLRGFTTVRDAGGADRGLADAIDEGLLIGPRLLVSGYSLSQTGGHADFRPRTNAGGIIACACQLSVENMGRVADGIDECRRAARDELRKGAHQIKIMAGGGVSSPTDPIHNTQYSEGELLAIVEEAEAFQTYCMAHAYTPKSIQRVIKCGVRSIEHGNLMDQETANIMAETGTFHVPTNATYWALLKNGKEYGFPQESLDKLQEIVEIGLTALEYSKNAGTKIAHGSDLLGPCHVYQSNEFNLKSEVLSTAETLRSTSTVNAELFNRPDLGTISAGATADIIIVDGDPLADMSVLDGPDGPNIPLVMKDGRVFKDALTGAAPRGYGAGAF